MPQGTLLYPLGFYFNAAPCKVRSLPISSGKYGCRAQILSIQGIRRFKSSLHHGPLLQLSEESEGCFVFGGSYTYIKTSAFLKINHIGMIIAASVVA